MTTWRRPLAVARRTVTAQARPMRRWRERRVEGFMKGVVAGGESEGKARVEMRALAFQNGPA
jgi:hypothetical protein